MARFRPQVSVFLARLDLMNRLVDGRWTHLGDPAYDRYLAAQMRAAIRILSSDGGKVVLLTTPYNDSGEQPNGQPWPEDEPWRANAYNFMLRKVAAEFPGTAFVIDLNRIADPGGHFQSVIDGVEVRYTDGVHWTYAGDRWLAPKLMPSLVTVARTGHQ